jgi:hypothetical protein
MFVPTGRRQRAKEWKDLDSANTSAEAHVLMQEYRKSVRAAFRIIKRRAAD